MIIMAGIYFHIPFCKQACHYCDFHFSTSLKYKSELVESLKKELILRQDYLSKETIETIYFGGGTPSILEVEEIKQILEIIFTHFKVAENLEISLEANPDDLDNKKVLEFKNSPVNRFSVGIQSFYDEDLAWMNRAHNAKEADSVIKKLQDAGFENLSLDLIYGFPLLTDEKWNKNIKKTIELEVPHISAYSMTVESKTALASFINKGTQKPMDEQQSARHFQILCDQLAPNKYEQYEISNFSFPDRHSKHNSNYWRGVPYLGIGPSAHSFNGNQRQWNVSNNALYMKGLAKNELNFELEDLSTANKINEYIMTTLRTKWGMDLKLLKEKFDSSLIEEVEMKAIEFIEEGKIKADDSKLILTAKGKLFADYIASMLFIDNNLLSKA